MDRFAELPFVVQHPETMNGRVFQTPCRTQGPPPLDRAGGGGLNPESDHGGIPVHGGDGACVLPLTFLSPDQRLSGHGSTPCSARRGWTGSLFSCWIPAGSAGSRSQSAA